MPQLWGAWLFLCFGVVAAVLVCIESIESGNYLAALGSAAIGLICAAGVLIPIGSRTVRRWWW